MYLVREKWSKQKSRQLLFRGLWPWAAEYNECSVSGCLFTLQLLHTIGIHQQWPGSAVGSIAKHHLVSERSLKLIKCKTVQSACRKTLSFSWTSWISNFTHYTNFIAKSSLNMDPKLSFILSCTFCLYYSGVKCHLCSLLWCHIASGKVEISPDWQSSAHSATAEKETGLGLNFSSTTATLFSLSCVLAKWIRCFLLPVAIYFCWKHMITGLRSNS